jgi:carboxylate-amine ligase
VPTWICAERAQRDYVLDNIGELVVKPIDGHGGAGVVIGPEAPERWRSGVASRANRSATSPKSDRVSTPTFDGEGFHHVDLPAFVHLRPGRRYGDGTRHAGRAERWQHADPHRELILGRRQQDTGS